MRNFRGIFPGMFTMGNLFCGFLSILSTMEGEAIHAARFILLGFFLDGLDGLVARVSRGATRFGVELDSLADLVSFGLAPAILVYSFQLKALGKWGWVLGFVFVMCGAFRLARYNLESGSKKRVSFDGLPIPAAASLLVTYVLFSYELWGDLHYPRFLVAMIIGSSALMVSTVSYEDRPNSFRTKKDRFKFVFLFVAAIAVLIDLQLSAFPAVLIYVLSGVAREIYDLIVSGNGRGNGDSPGEMIGRRRRTRVRIPFE